MAVQTRCPQCNKRYVAPDHMGGRRVRCRDCGAVFPLPAEPDPHYRNKGIAGGGSVAGEPLSASRHGTHAPLTHGGSRAGTTVAAAVAEAGPPGVAAESSDLQALESARAKSGGPGWTPPRANLGFDFPLARHVDRWLPLVLLAIGAGWLLSRTVASNPAGPGWVTVVRALVFLAVFAAVVFPAGRYAVRRAARKLHFALPPQSSWRLFAVLAVPFAAAVAMWLTTGGTVAGLVLGCVAGSIVLAGGLWLLFRLRPEELPVTLGAGVGAYVAGVTLSAALLVLVNQVMAAASAGGSAPTQLAVSPLGPGLPWPAPAAVPPKRAPGGEGVKPSPDKTVASVTPSLPPIELPPPERRPSDLPLDTDPAAGTGAGTGAVAGGGPDAPVATGGPAREGSAAPAAPAAPPSGAVVQQGGAGGASPGIVAVAPEAGGTAGKIVASVSKPIAQPVRELVYAPASPNLLAVVRNLGPAAPGEAGGTASGVRDQIQLWDARAWNQVAASITLSRPAGPAPAYHLSPDGKRVAYLSEFPALLIKVLSFETGGEVDLQLNRTPRARNGGGTVDLGQPTLLGFTSPTELVVHWRNGSRSGIETRTLAGGSTQRPLRQFDTVDFESETGHAALSPPRDHRLAVLTHRGPTAELYLYDLGARGDPARDCVHAIVPGLDWNLGVTPTALEFSPDGSRLVALFVLPGIDKAYFVSWNVRPGGGPIEIERTFNYFNSLRAKGSRGYFYGPSLRWLAGGDAWLAYGSAVFDARSGRHLGDLGLPNVIAHGTDGDAGCALLQMGDNPGASPPDAGLTVLAVTLKPEVMAGGEATPDGGVKPPSPSNGLFDVPPVK